MVKKGRQSKGKQVHLAKFDEEEVREIRRKYAEGISAVDLSRKYGVYRQTIGQIVRNKTWKHVN